MLVDTVNWLLLVTPFAPQLVYAPQVLLGLIGYQVAGLVVNGALGVVRLDKLPPLSSLNQLWLRCFYAWLWPLTSVVWLWGRVQRRPAVE